MAAHVGDESFVPFVPRQLSRVSEEPHRREQSAAPVNNAAVSETEPDAKAETETEAQTKTDTAPSKTHAAAAGVPTEAIQQSAAQDPSAAQNPSGSSLPTSRGPGSGCDHALEIRHEAIRLAAIACGRALRHAVLLHPGVIASFVDDAIAAAGLTQRARIRVHPASIAHIAAPQHDTIGDDALSPGDVEVESDGVTIGADTDTRAGLLVSAAAEA